MTIARYRYKKVDNKYIIKLSGDLKYKWSSGFNNFIREIFAKKDFDEIIIDITDTDYIDSTNIGLLAKIARFSLKHFSHKLPIIVDNTDVKELLLDMGFDKICKFIKEPREYGKDYETIENHQDTKKDLGKMILNAHKTLSEIDEKNKEQFKDVVNLFEKQRKEQQESDDSDNN